MIQSRPKFAFLALSGFVVVAGWSASAFAQSTCSTNADCDAGYECIKGVSTPGCDPSAGECGPSEPVEAEYGSCQKAPVECQTDADCGEYLTCQASTGDTACWTGPEGSGCDEPDPNATKYCDFKVETCTVDSDCPREFKCVASEIQECTDVGCDKDDFDCQSSSCETTTTYQCQPPQIECATDTECPSDWICMQFTDTSESCVPAPADSGGTAGAPTGTGTGTTDGSEPAPAPDERAEGSSGCVEESITRSLCIPAELKDVAIGSDSDSAGGVTSNGESATPGAPNPIDKSADKPKAKDADGGCSVAPALGASSGSWLSGLLLLAPLAARIGRRRRAS